MVPGIEDEQIVIAAHNDGSFRGMSEELVIARIATGRSQRAGIELGYDKQPSVPPEVFYEALPLFWIRIAIELLTIKHGV